MSPAERSAVTDLSVETRVAPWNFWRESLRAVRVLGLREVRTDVRMPAYFIPNLVVPVFFYFVLVGALEEFAGQSGIDNWQAFQLPAAIIFATQGGSTELNMHGGRGLSCHIIRAQPV